MLLKYEKKGSKRLKEETEASLGSVMSMTPGTLSKASLNPPKVPLIAGIRIQTRQQILKTFYSTFIQMARSLWSHRDHDCFTSSTHTHPSTPLRAPWTGRLLFLALDQGVLHRVFLSPSFPSWGKGQPSQDLVWSCREAWPNCHNVSRDGALEWAGMVLLQAGVAWSPGAHLRPPLGEWQIRNGSQETPEVLLTRPLGVVLPEHGAGAEVQQYQILSHCNLQSAWRQEHWYKNRK